MPAAAAIAAPGRRGSGRGRAHRLLRHDRRRRRAQDRGRAGRLERGGHRARWRRAVVRDGRRGRRRVADRGDRSGARPSWTRRDAVGATDRSSPATTGRDDRGAARPDRRRPRLRVRGDRPAVDASSSPSRPCRSAARRCSSGMTPLGRVRRSRSIRSSTAARRILGSNYGFADPPSTSRATPRGPRRPPAGRAPDRPPDRARRPRGRLRPAARREGSARSSSSSRPRRTAPRLSGRPSPGHTHARA